MPARLRPTAPIASEAILVGDPGRALMLAQELLQEPKMSNHARGLWGYTGTTEAGRALSIQSTGMGGPSASVVIADLAELGVRRAVRIGTCTSLGNLGLGELIVVTEAQPRALPDPELTEALRGELGDEARAATVVSLDDLYRPEREPPSVLVDAADMQTAASFAAAAKRGVAIAALLVVTEKSDSGQLRDEDLEAAAKWAARVTLSVL